MKKYVLSLLIAFLAFFSLGGIAKASTNVTTYDFITTDNGMQGEWATDNFHSTVTITSVGEGCYKVVRDDGGSFTVIDDAMSPGGVDGSLVGNGTKGTISGGVTKIICGDLRETPLSNETPEDLRVGEYSNYDDKYFHRYFSYIESSSWEDWGWTFTTCNNGTWRDNDETEAGYPSEAMGDITGIYIPCKEKETVNTPLTQASAFTCQGSSPKQIPWGYAKRLSSTSYMVFYVPTVVGGESNIRFREAGTTVWQHALRDYPNLGVAPLRFLKENVKYDFQITNGNGCNQSNWSAVFKGI